MLKPNISEENVAAVELMVHQVNMNTQDLYHLLMLNLIRDSYLLAYADATICTNAKFAWEKKILLRVEVYKEISQSVLHLLKVLEVLAVTGD